MLQVCAVNYRDCIIYVEHVLLHCLILFLLNLIQCLYHGIIVIFITKCLFHVHQQVLHGDIFAFIEGAGSFTWVPGETGMRAHTGFIILLKKDINIKTPECVHYFHTWVSQLKDRHVRSCRSQPLLLPTPPCGCCDDADGLWSHWWWNNHQSPMLPCLVRKG